jgi:hypothetical protein
MNNNIKNFLLQTFFYFFILIPIILAAEYKYNNLLFVLPSCVALMIILEKAFKTTNHE